MERFGQDLIQGMKNKLDVELIGVASVQDSPSTELKGRVAALLPKTKSVVVLGKEIYKEVVSLLKPSKEAGEAESGELMGVHSEYLSGRLNRAVHELASLFRSKEISLASLTGDRALRPEIFDRSPLLQTCSRVGRDG